MTTGLTNEDNMKTGWWRLLVLWHGKHCRGNKLQVGLQQQQHPSPVTTFTQGHATCTSLQKLAQHNNESVSAAHTAPCPSSSLGDHLPKISKGKLLKTSLMDKQQWLSATGQSLKPAFWCEYLITLGRRALVYIPPRYDTPAQHLLQKFFQCKLLCKILPR